MRLVTLLEETAFSFGWDSVAEWLQLAASLKTIKVDIVQHDPGFGYCSAADTYTMSREDLLNKFVGALAKFNFVWGALESCVTLIEPPKHPVKSKRGKIRDACYFIETYFGPKPPLPYLLDEVSKFRNAAQSCFGYQGVEHRFEAAADIGLFAIGLFAVYELRNSFAHGSLKFPEPDEENQPMSQHTAMVEHATRVVLLSIQMLLLAHFDETDETVLFSWNQDYEREEYPLALVLRGCHLVQSDENLQMKLF